MRKFLLAAGVVAALAIPAAGIAAELQSSHLGSSCKSSGLINWHFVNNQTGGATSGTLVAYFDTSGADQNGPGVPGDITLTDSVPEKHGPTLHFNVLTSGSVTLVGANTGSVPGKLVLSDFCKK
jgi:hypothetical protein